MTRLRRARGKNTRSTQPDQLKTIPLSNADSARSNRENWVRKRQKGHNTQREVERPFEDGDYNVGANPKDQKRGRIWGSFGVGTLKGGLDRGGDIVKLGLWMRGNPPCKACLIKRIQKEGTSKGSTKRWFHLKTVEDEKFNSKSGIQWSGGKSTRVKGNKTVGTHLLT